MNLVNFRNYGTLNAWLTFAVRLFVQEFLDCADLTLEKYPIMALLRQPVSCVDSTESSDENPT